MRVEATPAALDAIARLCVERGPVMFMQSGGCCDGSLPLCFPVTDFSVGVNDVLLGEVGGCPFYIQGQQDEAWGRPRFILDVADGLPEGFSLAAGDDAHFVTSTPSCPVE